MKKGASGVPFYYSLPEKWHHLEFQGDITWQQNTILFRDLWISLIPMWYHFLIINSKMAPVTLRLAIYCLVSDIT